MATRTAIRLTIPRLEFEGTMTKLISVEQFRKEVRAKRDPSGAVFRVSAITPKALDDGSRTIRFCFSDGNVDRMGDTIDPAGWDLTDFNRNPVALWAHDSSAPPIGRASNVGIEGQRLMGDIEFAPPETYAFADTIYRLTLGNFLNAVSVGFIPIDYEWSKEDDREWGIDFLKQTLLEISVCPVPANPNALGEARAKGIDTRPLVEWAEKALDGAGKIIIPRSELERLRKAAKEPPMARRAVPHIHRRTPAEDEQNCGRKATDTCGMDDPSQCSIHREEDPDDDAEKALLRALKRILAAHRKDADDGDPKNEPPLAHEDAIRMAHKCMRTAKAFQAEAMGHYAKAMDHLDGVVDALNEDGTEDPDSDPPADDDPDAEKAAQLRRAAALKRKHKA
jgi:HK97 family phage prohead protease